MHISLKREVVGSGAGKTGLVIISIMLGAAFLAPLLAPVDPYRLSTSAFLSPSTDHWLGTNHVGADIWSRLIFGARTSLLVGFAVGVLTVILGTAVGVSAALWDGLYDRVVMRVVDALIIIPGVIVIVLVAAYVKPSVGLLIFLLAILGWQGGARIIRAQALSIKEKGHVSAAVAFGAPRRYIGWRHIIPDLGPILVVDFLYGVRRAVFMEAGLAFLGISDPRIVSWGTMMRDALRFSYMEVWQWWLMPTGLALSLTIVGLTFIAYASETVIDPRLRGAEIA